MAAASLYLVALYALATTGATPAQTSEDTRTRQLYYAPQQVPQAQRLTSSLDSNVATQFYRPNQLKQDLQTFSLSSEDKGQKLETLEPDAELLPGAQQPQNPTGQIPVTPAAGIPQLLPGQQVYVVHPQHQVYMNALYPGLTNGFRPNVPIQGYQRFFIVPQATAGDGTIAGPGGYQGTILVDPLGQPVATQYFQPNYQRFVAQSQIRPEPQTSATGKAEPLNADPAKYQEPGKNIREEESLIDKNSGSIRSGNREPSRTAVLANLGMNRIGDNTRTNYQDGYQQTAHYIGAQPQLGFAAQQNAFPFFEFRQPFYPGQTGDIQNNSNGIPFAQGVQPGQFPPVQYQGGQFPAGQFSPGLYQSEQFPIAQLPVGRFQPGQSQTGQFQAVPYAQGQIQPGQFQPGQFQPGRFQSGQVRPGNFQPGQFQTGQFQAGQFSAGQYPGTAAASPANVPQALPQEAQGRNGYGYDDISDDVSTEANNNIEETSSKDGEKLDPATKEANKTMSKETIETTSTTEPTQDDEQTNL